MRDRRAVSGVNITVFSVASRSSPGTHDRTAISPPPRPAMPPLSATSQTCMYYTPCASPPPHNPLVIRPLDITGVTHESRRQKASAERLGSQYLARELSLDLKNRLAWFPPPSRNPPP